MPRLETTILDRFVNGAFAGKRKIGRPLKYNIRHKGAQGWIELVFNPRTRVEQYVSEALRFIHPYLFFVTYRFHVEKAREAGKYQKLESPNMSWLTILLNESSSHHRKRIACFLQAKCTVNKKPIRMMS